MAWYSGEVQASSYIIGRLVVEETRSGNNTSTVRATLQLRRTNTYGGITRQYGPACNIKIVIDGETFTIGQRENSHVVVPAYNNNWINFASAVKTINHNEARTISCSWYTENMGQYLSCSGSMSCTLAAFVSKVSVLGLNTTSTSDNVAARIWWMNQYGVQIHVACEEIDDLGNYISTIAQWTNQADSAGQLSEKYYTLTASQRALYDSIGRNRIRWTIKTVSGGSVLYYDCHDYDYYRASTPSVSPFTVGSSVPIRTYRQRTNMTHTVTLLLGNSILRTISDVGAITDWDSSADESIIYAQESQKSSAIITVQLDTYINSKLIGRRAVDITATFRLNDIMPLFTNFEFKDSNSQVVAITGNDQVIVKDQSNLVALVSAANKMVARQSAAGKAYTFTLGSTSITQAFSNTDDVLADFGKVSVAGTQRLIVKAFDSRSISASIFKDIQVVDYATPVITPKIERQNNFESRTTVKLEGEFYLVPVNDVTKNTITNIQCRYRKAQETNWRNWQELDFSVSEKDGKGIVSGSSGGVLFDLDNTCAWDFEFQITDRFTSATAQFQVSVGIPIIHFGADGRIGINCVPEGYDKGLFLNAKDQVFKQIYPVGAIFESTESVSPEAQFGGGWQHIGTRNVGSYTIYTFQRSY